MTLSPYLLSYSLALYSLTHLLTYFLTHRRAAGTLLRPPCALPHTAPRAGYAAPTVLLTTRSYLKYLRLDRSRSYLPLLIPRGPSSLPLLTIAIQAILQTRVGSRPRFVGPGQRLLTLCTLSLVVMHWYACGMWLIGERQAAAGRGTWVSQVYV